MNDKLSYGKSYPKPQALILKWKVDLPFLLGILLLSGIGLFIMYSAKQEIDIVERQLLRLGLAGGLMLGLAQIPPRFYRSIAPWLYGLALALLISVLLLGVISKGAQRWLDLWAFRFQPAELMKIAVPLLIARYLDTQTLPPSLKTLIIPMILIMIPVILVAKQPDLGTALLILSAGLLVIFFAGITWRLLASLGSLALIAMPLLWFVMRDYQKQRVLTLLDPERDPLGTGYHIIQSKIAIGSGGFYGKGWLNGTQSQLDFIPERTTDFIFAVFGEEFGLVGCLILISLYFFLILRGLYISANAQDTFNRLVAGSLTLSLFVYIFVNIGMVTGILPVVGIPLPLVSYGGTSLVTIMASFGILMSIHSHRTLLPS